MSADRLRKGICGRASLVRMFTPTMRQLFKKKRRGNMNLGMEHRPALAGLSAIIALSFVLLMPHSTLAQSASTVQSILNADGTVKAAVTQGSFDAHGYKMVLSKDGSPRFLKTGADPNDVNWDGSFTVPGVGGEVLTLAVNGTSLYVGGSFGSVGNVIAHNIAVFDMATRTWSPLDSAGVGTDGPVYSIAFNGGDVYVGGAFRTAGTIGASSIAMWDQTSGWSALGSGTNNSVFSMLYSRGNLFAAGGFTTAGGNPAGHIAMWNGTSWSALGTGLNSMGMLSLVIAQGDLYVCGTFTTAGGVTVNRVARWNGTTWSALGSGTPGTDGEVDNIVAVGDSVLYAGGNFTAAGGVTASSIAKYSIASDSWSALGGGLNGIVYGICADGNSLYVSGDFTTAGIVSANRIAKWDMNSASWSNLGDGLNNTGWQIAVAEGIVYVGGFFTTAGKGSAYGVASWDGTQWSALSTSGGNGSVGGAVQAIAVRGDSVFVGGDFRTAGSSPALNIAVWDKSTGQWSALDNTPTFEGVDGPVYTILPVASGDVYIGGSFSHAGNKSANNIVKWNPSTGWSAIGTGTDGTVQGMTLVASNLYVCGSFTHAGGNPANYVAQWNGTSWSSLGSGLSGSASAIALAGGKIYVGGSFGSAGGNPVNHIASWDGSNWTALGSGPGVGDAVYAIAVCGDTSLYVGGSFTTAGSTPTSGIVKYSIAGDSWSALSGGLNSVLMAIAIRGDTVFAGGYFTTAGLLTANSIATWNIQAKQWSALGSGTDRAILAIATGRSSDLYVGGVFSLAGGKPSYSFGRYNPNLTPVHEPVTHPRTFALSQNFPNPFNPTTVVVYQLSAVSHVTLTVYDVLGRRVKTLVDRVQGPGSHEVTFSAAGLSSGVYFYRIETGSYVQTRKMVLMK